MVKQSKNNDEGCTINVWLKPTVSRLWRLIEE